MLRLPNLKGASDSFFVAVRGPLWCCRCWLLCCLLLAFVLFVVALLGGLDLDADVVRAEALKRCAVQRFAVVRMGNADEQLGALLE